MNCNAFCFAIFILIFNRSVDKDDRQNAANIGKRPQAGCPSDKGT